MYRITSPSPRVTRALAAALAEELRRRPPILRHATVVALEGSLGAGKTTFAQAFARAAGVRRNLPSPTFTFVRRYPLPQSRYRNLFHVDAYRVSRATRRVLSPLGVLEELHDPRNIFVIEWADRIRRIIPRPACWVTFRHPPSRGGAETRTLTLRTR